MVGIKKVLSGSFGDLLLFTSKILFALFLSLFSALILQEIFGFYQLLFFFLSFVFFGLILSISAAWSFIKTSLVISSAVLIVFFAYKYITIAPGV